MLRKLLFSWAGATAPREHKVYQKAKRIYDRFAARIGLTLEGPAAHQRDMARDDPELRQAEALYREALLFCEKVGQVYNGAAVHAQLGMLYQLRGQLIEAEGSFHQALSGLDALLKPQRSSQEARSICHFFLGKIALEAGDSQEARTRLQACLDIDQILGLSHRHQACMNLIARCGETGKQAGSA